MGIFSYTLILMFCSTLPVIGCMDNRMNACMHLCMDGWMIGTNEFIFSLLFFSSSNSRWNLVSGLGLMATASGGSLESAESLGTSQSGKHTILKLL